MNGSKFKDYLIIILIIVIFLIVTININNKYSKEQEYYLKWQDCKKLNNTLIL